MPEIESFQPKELNSKRLEQLIDLQVGYHRELHPEDPPRSRELIRDFLLHPHPLWSFCRWLVIDREEDKVVGSSVLCYENEKSPQYENKRNSASAYGVVDKDYRRRGLGSQLLELSIEEARRLHKKQLQGEFSIEPARAFLLKHGATIFSERRLRRLYLSEVNPDIVRSWRQDGAKRNSGVKLLTFRVIPEELLEGYVELYNGAVRQAPDYDSDKSVAMELTSAVDRRETEKLVAEKNIAWVTIVAQDANDALSGFTEIFQKAAEPFVLNQGMTGVLKEYRQRGLGKWLKAEMVDYIAKNLKGAGCIETGNADANAAMITINEKIGFRDCLPHALFCIRI